MSLLSSLARPLWNLARGRPVLAIFEACLRCNSHCGYCNLPLNKGHYELTREEIRQVFSRLYRDNGIRYLFVQGGEPLLRKDLVEILQDLAKIGYRLGLVTNGTLLTPSIIKRLAQLPISISVSFVAVAAIQRRAKSNARLTGSTAIAQASMATRSWEAAREKPMSRLSSQRSRTLRR